MIFYRLHRYKQRLVYPPLLSIALPRHVCLECSVIISASCIQTSAAALSGAARSVTPVVLNLHHVVLFLRNRLRGPWLDLSLTLLQHLFLSPRLLSNASLFRVWGARVVLSCARILPLNLLHTVKCISFTLCVLGCTMPLKTKLGTGGSTIPCRWGDTK